MGTSSTQPTHPPPQLHALPHTVSLLQVILPTLLTAAIAAKLPTYTYSQPFAQDQHPGVGAAQSPAHAGTSELTNGQAEQNGLTQTYGEPNGRQPATPFNGQAGQPGLTQGYSGPNGQQAEAQFNGQAGQNGLVQSYGGPSGETVVQFNGHAGQNGIVQSYDGPNGETVAQLNGQAGQNGLVQSQAAPNGPAVAQLNGHAGQNGLVQSSGGPNGQTVTQFNGQTGQNGLTQIYGVPDEQQTVTQFNGQAGQNGFVQSFGGPNGQAVTQFNGQAGQNGLAQSYGEPQGLIQVNGYSGQNGLTQTYSGPAGPQDLTQTNGNSGSNGHTQTYGAPNGSQNLIPSNGLFGQNGLTQTNAGLFGSQELAQTNGHTGPNAIPQGNGAPVSFHGQTLQQGSTDQDSSFETYEPAEPHSLETPQEAARPVPGGSDNGCLEGQVPRADGSCVTPEVTRSVYVFGVPETPRPSTTPPPLQPTPRVHEHVLLIRAPERWSAGRPLVLPPPAHKSVVYVLRKELPDEEPQVFDAPVTPPAHPEVFFVDYKDGDNVSLPNGLDLQQALQDATTGPAALLDAPAEADAAVDAHVPDFSAPVLGNDFSLQGQGDEDLASYGDRGFTSGNVRDGAFVLEGHSGADFSLEGQTDGTFVLLNQRDDDDFIDHSGEDFLAGLSYGSQALQDSRNGGQGFVLNGHSIEAPAVGFQSDEALFFRGHSDEGFVLNGNNVGSVTNSNGDTASIVFGNESRDYGFTSLEDSLLGEPASRENTASIVLGGSSQQAQEDVRHTVPAQLLSVSFDGSSQEEREEVRHPVPAQLLSVSFDGSNSNFGDTANGRQETAVRGVEGSRGSPSQTAASGGASHAPPARPAAGPAQLYAAPA